MPLHHLVLLVSWFLLLPAHWGVWKGGEELTWSITACPHELVAKVLALAGLLCPSVCGSSNQSHVLGACRLQGNDHLTLIANEFCRDCPVLPLEDLHGCDLVVSFRLERGVGKHCRQAGVRVEREGGGFQQECPRPRSQRLTFTDCLKKSLGKPRLLSCASYPDVVVQ